MLLCELIQLKKLLHKVQVNGADLATAEPSCLHLTHLISEDTSLEYTSVFLFTSSSSLGKLGLVGLYKCTIKIEQK